MYVPLPIANLVKWLLTFLAGNRGFHEENGCPCRSNGVQCVRRQDMMDWAVGSTPTWSVVAVVMDPNGCAGFATGDLVQTAAPWRRYNAISTRTARKLDSAVPAEAYLGTLGGTGNAGYLPVVHIGKPKSGEVAFVSGAAGATGLVAAQSLKLLGCVVVGSAGSDDKVALLESLGIHAFNYKTEDTLAALQRLCPEGVDIYFDNVGGPTLECALEVMNDFGRVIACGQISQVRSASC